MDSYRKALAHRAASGALWVSVQTWGNQLVRFGVFLLLARLLGPEAFGILTLALVVTVLGERLIAEGGWSEALIRNRQLHPADLDSVFWFLIGASLVFVGCAAVLAAPAADWFDQPEIARILPWLAWVMPLYALNVVPRALLQRRFDFRNLAMASLAGTLGGGLTAGALALTGWGSGTSCSISWSRRRSGLSWSGGSAPGAPRTGGHGASQGDHCVRVRRAHRTGSRLH